NAAMASINHQMFPTANSVDSTAIDSLESALNNSFQENPNALNRSVSFGKSIAAAIFAWSETDGYKHENDPYTPPVGPGLWVPTPPAFAKASTPYWGNNRPIISGSTDGTFAGTPIPYSESPKSPFYQEVFEVYNASQNLTPDQIALALFWRDYPIGLTTAGHWLSILHQVLNQTNTNLAKAAIAYALSGTSMNDASISCWQAKYTYNQVRPITYIRNVLGFSTWNALIATPAHPEYPSAHTMLSGASAEALEKIFGDIGTITDHSYDYLGMSPRTYASFTAIVEEVGNARVLAGLHYRPSCDTGFVKGTRVADNIFNIITWQH
ncbi:MAG TPA: vanadium-dependent haloperoxidase, partial [Puia sp.]|nr:vanadium-dependent haloperoxidase [Puia sp.]